MVGAVEPDPVTTPTPSDTGSASVSFCDAIAEIGLSNGPLNLVTKGLLRALNRIFARGIAFEEIGLRA